MCVNLMAHAAKVEFIISTHFQLIFTVTVPIIEREDTFPFQQVGIYYLSILYAYMFISMLSSFAILVIWGWFPFLGNHNNMFKKDMSFVEQ